MGLDLSRIEAWTREMLEAEARRRRIRNPQFRTRGELMRLILKHQYGDRFSAGRERIARGIRTIEQARELLGMAVGAALSALPEPLGSIARTPPEPTGESSEPPAPRIRQNEIVPPARDTLDAAAYLQTPIAQSFHVPAAPDTIDGPHLGASDPGPHSETEPAQTFEMVPPPILAGPFATTHTFIEEPIRTRTMARVLSMQGHRERALMIYEELLAQNSEDAGLLAELETVRRGEALVEPLLPDPPLTGERWPLPDTGDELSCAGNADRGLLLRWHVTSDGQRRARAVLGGEGELALRVISIGPDPDRVVRSEITEHGPVPERGEWNAPSPARGVRCVAAVGVRAGSRFVAIAHAHPS